MINRRNVLKATAVGGSGLAALAYSPRPALAASDWTVNSPSQVSNDNGELSSLEIPASGFSFSLDYAGFGSGSHSIEFELEAKLKDSESYDSVFIESFDVEGDSGTADDSKLSTSFPVDLLSETSLSASDFNEPNVGETKTTTVELRVSFSWSDSEYSASSSSVSSFDVSVERTIVGTTNGLVSYYPFNGDVDDAWGNNDGTDNTSTGYVDGVSGQAKNFDGTDDYVSTGITSLTGSFTVMGWVITNTDDAEVRFMAKDEVGNPGHFILRPTDKTPSSEFMMYDASSSDWIRAYTGAVVGSQVHIAGVYDDVDGTVSLFMDGELVDTSSGLDEPNEGSNELVIGADSAGDNEFLDEWADDVRIYDRALSESEITEIYNETS
jgi:hypothetical protein